MNRRMDGWMERWMMDRYVHGQRGMDEQMDEW